MTVDSQGAFRAPANASTTSRLWRPPSRWSTLLTRGLLVLCSSLVCLALTELAVRALEPREVMRHFFSQDDPFVDHRLIPNAKGRHKTLEYDVEYQINSLGLRDREYSLPKPPGTFRILMVGDSFTEGVGVSAKETFSKQLEERLRDRPGPMKFEVINAGVASYSPLLEYLYLKEQGLRLQPDLVVLNFDLSDLHDDITYTARARVDERGIPIGVGPSPDEHEILPKPLIPAKDWLKAHVRLYSFVRVRLEPLRDRLADPADHSGDIHRDKYALLRETYVDGERSWALTHRYLLLIRDLLQERGIDFWVTVYPYGHQVHPKEWSSGRRFWQFRPDTVYSTWPQEALERWTRVHGIKAINMCPEFREVSRTTFPLYWAYDGHWMPRGHALVADVLLRNLGPYLAARTGPGRDLPSSTAAAEVGSRRRHPVGVDPPGGG
jgi:hypothetical protein